MDISDLVCISNVDGVYQCWYFNIDEQQYSYTTHQPLTTRRIHLDAFTKLCRVFDDGVEIQDVKVQCFLPLTKDSAEDGIKKFFKLAILS